jgi:hypothetical protein
MKEVVDFGSTLGLALPAHDTARVSLAVAATDAELRELTEQFPDHKNSAVTGGQKERRKARAALKDLVLCLRRIDLAVAAGRYDEATAKFREFTNVTFIEVPALLKEAQPWSLFNPDVHAAHYHALAQMLQVSARPTQ